MTPRTQAAEPSVVPDAALAAEPSVVPDAALAADAR